MVAFEAGAVPPVIVTDACWVFCCGISSVLDEISLATTTADKLVVSVHTVRNHASHIPAKLNVRSRDWPSPAPTAGACWTRPSAAPSASHYQKIVLCPA